LTTPLLSRASFMLNVCHKPGTPMSRPVRHLHALVFTLV
jgi:hypothetical protein